MKIEGNRPNVDAALTEKLEANRVGAGSAREYQRKAGTDAVTVSPEVKLANDAIASASQQPAIRPEAVERGRALLASGRLGQDAGALANALIDRMLEEI